ncbi:hypothetical protein JX265_013279 [Neoarthrinium moseri]|uniref:Non-structural maintenance of chromosomes element 4 n=1 Tax=Neoarthrinium moseri TaxID=1658444 RepID=A0A9Q0AG30_9PEZI|nr:uncharacterized protein JN550_003238 [Neoarthrinium moseri]KAI1851161.1 hypothetical protein JX265_013279 [Neoarthrinium moseri]KAI1851852.1 hypothetical protein JX266_002705 [Neoarthrinium moseri]KAI1873969.1 hypothetical protein JN550_003238 [Neoarthrinium moseri]
MSSSPPASGRSASPSDQEDDDTRTLVMRNKGSEAAKRKRAWTNGAGRGASRRRTHDPTDDDEGNEDDDDNSDEYDPDQPIEERRVLQRGLRELREETRLNKDKYIQPGDDGLRRTLRKANTLNRNVKQTTEATLDSRLMVETVELSYKKTAALTSGDAGQGVDIDGFVTECLRYMRLGAGIHDDDAQELTSTQRQRRRSSRGPRGGRGGSDDEDEIGDEGDACNWEHLGRFACLPHVRRPATPGFLLGPLSVEKKARKVAKRSAPFRPNSLRETRPEVLEAKDIQRNEDNDLAAICSKTYRRLEEVHEEAQDSAEAAFEADNAEEGHRIMQKFGLRTNGGIDYFKFVINPKSFGQTIENMFYVSFLIRDNKISLEFDDDGFPTLAPVEASEPGPGGARHASKKQQAIFHLDPVQYRAIIDAFDITESLIEHRKEQTNNGPGARGWYN